jgi:hypothetical protein
MGRRQRSCEREAEVRQMVRSGEDAPALRAHASTCEPCHETLVVATWMKAFAASPLGGPPLPDPTHTWLRAEMLRRWDAQRKAVAPIDVGERVQVGIGLAGALILLLWLWSRLDIPQQSVGMSTAVTIMLSVSAVLLAGAASVVVRLFVTRE